MTIAAYIAAILLSAALFQGIFAILFTCRLWRYKTPPITDEKLPTVSILLSLRGADPDMEQGLRMLMTQDYPDYDLQIVVDRESDPAWKVVQDAVADTGFKKVRVDVLRERTGRCSLKNCAAVQMVRQLDDSREVMVLADGDLVAHPHWLREVVAPFRDPRVGATSGCVWFWPEKPTPGAMVRALFMAASVIAMYTFKIAWGGTTAIRVQALKKSGVIDRWARSINEDMLVSPAMRQQGLDLVFVPGLMMANREDCSLSFTTNFIKRQMTSSRLYLTSYPSLLLHAFGTNGLVFVAFVLGILGVIRGDQQMAMFGLGGAIGYEVAMLLLHAIMESGLRKVIGGRGEPTPANTLGSWLNLLWALPLTQVVYLWALLRSILEDRVVWRGVVYRIRGPFDIQIEQDQPFEQNQTSMVRQSL